MNHWRRIARWLGLLVIPAVFAWTAAGLARARGPLWLALNSDPSYQYLLNSLLILNGEPPCHVDHPGTTVQAIGAAVIQETTPGHNTLEQTYRVLAQPEEALASIHVALVALTAVTLLLGGILLLAQLRSLGAAVAAQVVPLAAIETWRGTLFVAPEALLVAIGVAFTALVLVRDLRPDAVPSSTRIWVSIAIGVVAGAGIVTKVTFLPLCLLPLLAARSARLALWTAVATIISTTVYLLPIATQLPRMLKWLGAVATHTGTYGTGHTGFIDPTTYLPNVAGLMLAEPLLPVVLVASAAAGLWSVRSRRSAECRTIGWLLVSAVIVQVLAVLMVAKHPDSHYLLPAFVSLGFNAVCLVVLGANVASSRSREIATAMGITTAALIAVTGARVHRLQVELGRDATRQLAEARQADEVTAPGVRVEYYRCSSVAFALYLGNGAAWRMFARPLDRLYPNRLFLNPFTGSFESYSGPVATNKVLHDRPVFFVGNRLIEHLPPGASLPHAPGWTWSTVRRTPWFSIRALIPPRR